VNLGKQGKEGGKGARKDSFDRQAIGNSRKKNANNLKK